MSLAHGVLMPGFSGRTPPQWIATAAHTGLAGVVLFAENTPTTEATRALTDALLGLRPRQIEAAVDSADLAELAPIDDVRGSAGYRGVAAREPMTSSERNRAPPCPTTSRTTGRVRAFAKRSAR